MHSTAKLRCYKYEFIHPALVLMKRGCLCVYLDPCASLRCLAGRACVVTDKGKGACQCVTGCEEETDPRRRVGCPEAECTLLLVIAVRGGVLT